MMKQTEPDPLYLIHELEVHQIELEMQNEELRRAQDALLAEKKRFQDLYDQVPVGYLSLSDRDLVVDANKRVHTLLGMDRGELLQQPFTRFILPEDQDLFYLFRRRFMQTNTQTDVDLRMLHADGSPVWARLSIALIQSSDHDTTQSFGITITDISEKKQLEEALFFLANQIPGESFFPSLTRYLAQALGIDFVCINLLEGDGLHARPLAVYHNGKFSDDVCYALQDTPCCQVVDKDICSFPADVCRSFPENKALKEVLAESYVGITLRGSSGQPIGLIAVIGCRPLTNQAQVEAVLKLVAVRAAGELEHLEMIKELTANEARYQRAVNGANDGLWEFIPATSETYLSPRLKHLLGYEDQELPSLQASVFDRIHPEDKSRVMEALCGHLEKGTPYNIEYRLRCKNGEYHWFVSRGRAERDEYGQPTRMTGFISDITNRKEVEQVLQRQHETYQDILATIPDGFWLTDLQGRIIDVNDSYCRQSGYTRQELLTMYPFDLDVKESAAETADHIQRMLTGGSLSTFEATHRRKDGSTWDVEISVGVSNKAGGQLVAFLRDITERKHAEEMKAFALQEKNVLVQELRERIKINVRVIEDVIALQARLAHSLLEKEVLLKEVHHRVKNNLQVIHSMLSLQARRIVDSETHLLFAASMNRVYTMSLIHEKLCHVKNLASINFNDYLKSLVDAIVTTYPCPHIRCVVETEPVFLDLSIGTPCGLIAHELITNSIIHAFPDGRQGTIRVGIRKQSPGLMVLTVTDNGVGYQSELEDGSSSSLGIQIVRGLTAQIHGTIESFTTDGARVCITFPEKSLRNEEVSL
ncbi:MAG: PAS domain S-box protein [Pseudomonadota bacterium]